MVYSIKDFLKIDKYSAIVTSIIEFPLLDVLKHVLLNVFVEIQIVSYKSSTALCSIIYINGYIQFFQIFYRL